MGYATTRTLERVLASCGLLTSAGLEFIPADDVPQGGVLLALPALLTEGLLRHTRRFYSLPPGFYPLESIFLYLAYWSWCGVLRWNKRVTRLRGNGANF